MLKDSAMLIDRMREFAPDDLVNLMGVSQKIAELNTQRFMNWQMPFTKKNAKQALSIADKGFVLVQGRNRYTDTGAALLADKDVRKAFLGG